MTLETLRQICLALPGATEDIKWGQDLVFSVGKKMFCAVNAEPPHQFGFKTTPEDFGELIERPGMMPAPYLARAMWVQEERLGTALEPHEIERLVRQAYELVLAKLPKRVRAELTGATPRTVKKPAKKTRATPGRGRRRRTVPSPRRRRRR